MAKRRLIQGLWDTIRGKKKKGAVASYEAPPSHCGAKYVYPGTMGQIFFREILDSDSPAFIARPGRTELQAIGEFLNRMSEPNPRFPERRKKRMSLNAGFFTPSDESLTRFACESLEMLRDADLFVAYGEIVAETIIGEWYLPPKTRVCSAGVLSPMLYESPWTKSLRGKKVLVVHPFTDTIVKQYRRRELLFDNPDVLPEFELKTIKAVQSAAYNKCDFPDWFAALDHMKSQIDGIDFDVALIGAGAYGFFLAHHCKTLGKKGVQMASHVQLLFGIKGKRWTEQTDWMRHLINEHWVAPAADERPENSELVDHGCYW